jgi:hypothetical protein
MKRFHVHVGVDDLAASIQFCSTLFAAIGGDPGDAPPASARNTSCGCGPAIAAA